MGVMKARRVRLAGTRALLPALAAVLISCSSSVSSATPTPRPTPTRTPIPTPSETPDNLTVMVSGSGVGSYLLAAIPVAVIKNDAGGHAVTGVIVHFITKRGGSTLGSLDSVPVNLAAGESLGVAANCTDACNNANGVDVSLAVGGWRDSPGVTFTASGATYQCGTCRGGHGYGRVSGTLSTGSLGQGVAVAAFAVCRDSSGTILGGGTSQLVWPGGSSMAIQVSVVINDAPASCELGASTGW